MAKNIFRENTKQIVIKKRAFFIFLCELSPISHLTGDLSSF